VLLITPSAWKLPRVTYGVAALVCVGLALSIEGAVGSRGQASGTGGATLRVVVGPGIAEDTVRQVIRTAGGMVYVFAPDDTAQRMSVGAGVLRAYRATGSGSPRGFVEVDATHHPESTGTRVLYAPDVRLDRRGVAHMVYVDQAGSNLYYQTFSTVSNTWGSRHLLGSGALANPGFYSTPNRVYRNWASYGLVLDAQDRPHVVYCSGNSVYSRFLASNVWTTPQLVASGISPIHVQLAADTASNIYATWLNNPLGPPGSSSVMYAKRSAATSSWTRPQVVDKGNPNVLSDVTDDQGPSIVVTAANIPYVMYLNGTTDSAGKAISTATVRYLHRGHWLDDTPPSSGYKVTHSPQLYSRGNDVYLFLGHDINLHWGYLIQRTGHLWSPYKVLDNASLMDGSASVRSDPQHDNNPGIIDAIHHSEDYQHNQTYLPQLYYQALTPTK